MPALDLVVPPACTGCGRLGSLVCGPCRTSFRPPRDPGDAFLIANPGAVVGDALTLALAAFAYEGVLRRCLARLKYVGARRVAATLADAGLPTLERLVTICGRVPVAAVPAHPDRLSERGYNQAALLADALAARTRLSRIEPLVRRRSTERQHRLDRAARVRNLESAFAVAVGTRPPPALILVDDILTTSATLEACARVMRRHGTDRVYGFVIAREV